MLPGSQLNPLTVELILLLALVPGAGLVFMYFVFQSAARGLLSRAESFFGKDKGDVVWIRTFGLLPRPHAIEGKFRDVTMLYTHFPAIRGMPEQIHFFIPFETDLSLVVNKKQEANEDGGFLKSQNIFVGSKIKTASGNGEIDSKLDIVSNQPELLRKQFNDPEFMILLREWAQARHFFEARVEPAGKGFPREAAIDRGRPGMVLVFTFPGFEPSDNAEIIPSLARAADYVKSRELFRKTNPTAEPPTRSS